ncbi:MAG: division/cell wall cluster transcriptional repressor MraZ [Thermoflexales bacterium]
MFLGEFVHNLDEKSRLTLPAKFRAQLAGGVVLTTSHERCLLMYPAEEFRLLFERISALPTMSEEAAMLRRMVFTNAHDVEPDKQSRVLIPQRLRDYANIRDSVVIVGVGKFIELWSPEAWERTREALRQLAEQKEIWQRLGI